LRQGYGYGRGLNAPGVMPLSVLTVERISDLFCGELATLGFILLKQKIESPVEPVRRGYKPSEQDLHIDGS